MSPIIIFSRYDLTYLLFNSDGYRFVRRVAHLVRDGIRIDVIEPSTACPLLAITQFWTTLLMNYITPDGVCVLYPCLTFAGVGLINPSSLNTDGIPGARVTTLMTKYIQREFQFALRHDALPAPIQAEMMLNTSCEPWKQRTCGDSDSFTLRFGTTSLHSRIGRPVAPPSPRVDWLLGGWEGGRLTHGEVSLHIGPPGVLIEYIRSLPISETHE